MPTEAEWEYAARAGTRMANGFDGDPKGVCRYGNVADLSAKSKYPPVNEACGDGYADLAPVARFLPNAWGLYDMHGNVWEWVWDRYGAYPERSPLGYAGPDDGDSGFRVLRGASYVNLPGALRSAIRFNIKATTAGEDLGFRCARGPISAAGRSSP